MTQHCLRTLLEKHHISQRELAAGIGKSTAHVSRLVSGETGASQETIEAVLAYLSNRLGKRMTYERVFGLPREISA
jgi:transcriptional regulator with XRE-family HTH domain